jgi:hypothetical protein
MNMDAQPVLSALSSPRDSLEADSLDWRTAIMTTPNAADPFSSKNVAYVPQCRPAGRKSDGSAGRTTALRSQHTMTKDLAEKNLPKLECIAPFEFGKDAEEYAYSQPPLAVQSPGWKPAGPSRTSIAWAAIKRRWKLLLIILVALIVVAIISSLCAVLIVTKRGGSTSLS